MLRQSPIETQVTDLWLLLPSKQIYVFLSDFSRAVTVRVNELRFIFDRKAYQK